MDLLVRFNKILSKIQNGLICLIQMLRDVLEILILLLLIKTKKRQFKPFYPI
jgi:hypothetical protein